MKTTLFGAFLSAVSAVAALAAETKVATFTFNGQVVNISQSTDISAAKLVQFAMIPSACNGPCSTPMVAARGVKTIGEFEVIEFLRFSVEPGLGLMIDARPPELRQAGHIPSSINIPLATLADKNPYRNQIFEALGGRRTGGGWNFANAYDLVVFGTGPGTTSAPDLIRELISVGYPSEKLRFYRGGMQIWAGLGFSFEEPRS